MSTFPEDIKGDLIAYVHECRMLWYFGDVDYKSKYKHTPIWEQIASSLSDRGVLVSGEIIIFVSFNNVQAKNVVQHGNY